MVETDLRGTMLRALDACADTIKLDQRFDSATADHELSALMDLAAAIRQSVDSWRPVVRRLRLSPRSEFDTSRAGALIIESVFDELLEPAAWRCLCAALDLASTV